mmetsp:Transcript_3479/g.21844  ORF Transcript_3479/g.21844 Transcript_3479/m.21844 type:complete len:202 (-) Transcript_3479:1182-1787(-)
MTCWVLSSPFSPMGIRHSTRSRPNRSASATSPLPARALSLRSASANTKCLVPPAGAIRSSFLATRDSRSMARAFAADKAPCTTELLSLSREGSFAALLPAGWMLLSFEKRLSSDSPICSRKEEHIPELFSSSSTPTSLQHRCGRGSKRTCLSNRGVSVRFSNAASMYVIRSALGSVLDPFSQTSLTLVVMRSGYSTSNLKC